MFLDRCPTSKKTTIQEATRALRAYSLQPRPETVEVAIHCEMKLPKVRAWSFPVELHPELYIYIYIYIYMHIYM